jgi:hypothetical protein
MIRAPIREHNINRPLAVILTAHFSGKEICNYLPMDDQSIPEEAGKTTAIFGSDARNKEVKLRKNLRPEEREVPNRCCWRQPLEPTDPAVGRKLRAVAKIGDAAID